MAKPRIKRIDWEQLVIDSLMDGVKKPAEIEKYLYQQARSRYESRHDLSEDQKNHQVKRETIKIRFIEYILSKLQDKGEVGQEKPLGKYFLTDRVFNNPKFVANIFGRAAISKLVKMNALSMNPFVKLDYNNLEEDHIDAESLSTFANNVGALITYVMLDAMNPSCLEHLKKGSDKDEFVLERIGNAIDIHRIFMEFCKMGAIKRSHAVYNAISKRELEQSEEHEKIYETQSRKRLFEPSNPKWSRYEMDKANFRRVLNSFARIYPNLYETLEEIKCEIPHTVQSYKKSYTGSVKKDRMTRRKSS